MISVIIPTYNAEKTIERAVESVLKQSCQDFEIILYDDCSTDNTWEVLSRLNKKDSRIRIFQNERNSKSAFTRNQAINEALGKYIMQLDDDDYCHVERMSKQVEFLDTHSSYDFVGSNAVLWDQEGIYSELKVPEKPQINDLLKTSPFINPSVMFRKKALDTVDGYRVSKETVRGQDYDLYLRMYGKGMKGYNLQENLVYYYQDKHYYSKISWKNRIGEFKFKYRNFQHLELSRIQYIYTFKPLLAIMIPRKLLSLKQIKRRKR
ncbi:MULTISPECIES: glycosyltransferase family 2 protein [unclassified Enterococcus]|uniref:glycosyltransferase family 2 protein n=1 Tax=unclassified Enterococcus TaxID=2608891 RepID=UPI0013EC976A|nr:MULTISPECIES: glycosyltransferase family 2 protein [unclassified Enterococcus]